jgi:hypothetical protein
MSTGWTPRIVPYGADQTVYLVVDRFGFTAKPKSSGQTSKPSSPISCQGNSTTRSGLCFQHAGALVGGRLKRYRPRLRHRRRRRSRAYPRLRCQPHRSDPADHVAARLSHAVSPAKAASRWHQGGLSRLHRTGFGDVNRQVPSGQRWLHKIKFDGYRVQVQLGREMYKHAGKTGLGGVSKVRDGRYPIGRTNDWVKVTYRQRENAADRGLRAQGEQVRRPICRPSRPQHRLKTTACFSMDRHPVWTSPVARYSPDQTRGTCPQDPCLTCRACPCRLSAPAWDLLRAYLPERGRTYQP